MVMRSSGIHGNIEITVVSMIGCGADYIPTTRTGNHGYRLTQDTLGDWLFGPIRRTVLLLKSLY